MRAPCVIPAYVLTLSEPIHVLSVFKLDPEAFEPTKATPAAAGFDVYALEETEIGLWSMGRVRTGLRILPPGGHYLRVTGRSGMTLCGALVQTGVIDPDYTGEIIVVFYNMNGAPLVIPRGLKIAQIVPEKYAVNCIMQMREELTPIAASGSRGARGFGSSGNQ